MYIRWEFHVLDCVPVDHLVGYAVEMMAFRYEVAGCRQIGERVAKGGFNPLSLQDIHCREDVL